MITLPVKCPQEPVAPAAPVGLLPNDTPVKGSVDKLVEDILGPLVDEGDRKPLHLYLQVRFQMVSLVLV